MDFYDEEDYPYALYGRDPSRVFTKRVIGVSKPTITIQKDSRGNLKVIAKSEPTLIVRLG
jgi:hypothetical protein